MPSGTVSSIAIKKLVTLQRSRAAKSPYTWARVFRIMPDGARYSIWRPPFVQPYLRDIYRAFEDAPRGFRLVVQKAAQLGITELLINLAFWFLQNKGENVLYMLPNFSQLADFAHARLDGAIEASPPLRAAFTAVDNVGLKIGWGRSLYLRGSNSKEKLLEISVGLLIRDEYDRMDPAGAAQAESRLAASRWSWTVDVSNPTGPGLGINALWLRGAQGVWELPCPKGHWHEPVWPDSVRDGRLVCPECGRPVEKAAGRWRFLNPDAPYPSFRLSQLVSPSRPLPEIEQEWEAAQGNPTRLQLFYNFVLGLPFELEAELLTPAVLEAAKGQHPARPQGPVFLGVDPGGTWHWYVMMDQEGRVVFAGKTKSFEGIAELFARFDVKFAICELRPETRLAKALAMRFPKLVGLFEYRSAASETGLQTKRLEGDVVLYKMSRTELLDEALAPIRRGEPVLPGDAPPELLQHLQALVRKRDVRRGREVYVYEASGPDHLAHALAFAHLARKVAERPVALVGPVTRPRVSPWRL